MKQLCIKFIAFSFAIVILADFPLYAQKDEKDKSEKKDVQQIIITRKNFNNDKTVIEINGDKVTINGKPLDQYKEKAGDINVRVQKLKELESLSRIPGLGTGWGFNGEDNNLRYFKEDANHAMLGVTTEKVNEGVEIQDITNESAAEKAGLKENDIITKIDDKKIEDPDQLSKVIRAHKPGDKVNITYLRDKKENNVTAELTKWKGLNGFTTTPGFKMDMGDMNLENMMPKTPIMPRMMAPYEQNRGFNWSFGGGPKLGISVQDTDDGKGVKVIEVDEESNAEKAGIKEDDIITEVDGKLVNSADEASKIIRESKDKVSVMIKLQRGGKIQNIEVKMPRKLKTADL
jgi:serine protease Do